MPTIVEDFESGNLDAYAGTTNAKLQQNIVFAGSWALTNEGITGSSNTITSVAGLNAYPAAGSTFEFRVRFEKDGSSNFHFGCQKALNQADRDDLYDINFVPQLSRVQFRVYIGTEQVELFSETSASSWDYGIWYRVQVEWGVNGDFSLLMEDDAGAEVLSGTANDTTYTSGGIGFRLWGLNNDSNQSYFDNIVILGDSISRTIRDDATGDTVSGARVIAISDNGDGIIAETQTSDTNGLVTFADLPSGTYALVAIDSGGNKIDAEYGVVIG